MTKQRTGDEQTSAELKTCFVIMPISDVEGYPAGHFNEVYKQLIEPAVKAANYECSPATSTSAAHMIQLEVVTRVATADLCICDLSTNNPNVLFEYGIRQAFDKPTVLIKDDKTRRIFDLSGFRDIEYDHTLRIANTLEARNSITAAIADTVNGSGDADQVFSLVKLMKLAKAALPSGDVSQDYARFTLLENKIDSLATKIAESQKISFSNSGSRIRYKSGYEVIFSPDSLQVLHGANGYKKTFGSLPELESSTFWRDLTSAGRLSLLNHIRDKSPDFIPF